MITCIKGVQFPVNYLFFRIYYSSLLTIVQGLLKFEKILYLSCLFQDISLNLSYPSFPCNLPSPFVYSSFNVASLSMYYKVKANFKVFVNMKVYLLFIGGELLPKFFTK